MPAIARIAFDNVSPSDALCSVIRDRIARLGMLYDGIGTCRVVLAGNDPRQAGERSYACRIDLVLPGQPILAGRDPGRVAADPQAAIAAAFDEAEVALTGFLHGRARALLSQPVVG